ncbi:hypothetical protein V6Z11_D08G072300 [Gossypium hirsutum]|uniref:Uncharacterized protein n=1 Tax=Gossypium tomentosum TaxID=34277 RepID=A0A5D2JRV3_GOSTO|nr:hypothetical protein ES332_D08G076900v1 [Gossypium tomentosum]
MDMATISACNPAVLSHRSSSLRMASPFSWGCPQWHRRGK